MSEKKGKYFVHESSYIDENVEIGEGTKIWHFSHIQSGAKIGKNCSIGQNVNIGNNVHIAKRCSIYGSEKYQLLIMDNCRIAMNTIINGYAALVKIGKFVNVAPNVNIMAESGPGSDVIRVFETSDPVPVVIHHFLTVDGNPIDRDVVRVSNLEGFVIMVSEHMDIGYGNEFSL